MNVLEDLEAKLLSSTKLRADGVPSASLALLENGTISPHVITTGSENPETIYQCGSISKAITAMGVAALVEKKTLLYDSKVAELLPPGIAESFLDPQTSHLFDLVTIRMLITHTSGLTQPYDPGHPQGHGNFPSAEQGIQGHPSTNSVRLRFASFPGAQLLYCSGTFTLLQLAMEHITGQIFSELMQELVMRPLGMTRTFYGDLPELETNFTKPHLNGYQATPTGVHRFAELAAVGLWSTPTDLLKATSAIQQALKADTFFLSQAVAREILIDGAIAFRSGAARHRCGLGWYSTSTVFAHRGANPGYHSYVFGFFDQSPAELHGQGFVIMTNSIMGLETIRPLVSAIMYLKGWPRQKLMPSSLGLDEYVPYAAPAGTQVDPAWKGWMGGWENDWSLLDLDGQPALQRQSMTPVRLLPAAAPCHTFHDENTKELMLVADGLSGIALRLTWLEGERIIELLQLSTTVLRKQSS